VGLHIQAAALRGFLAIARRRRLPILLHCRDAYEPLLEVLRAEMPSPIRGIIHCASGPPAFIREAVALGLHVSFAGNVTFPKADGLRALVELVPDDRLLLETDAPFLAPQPVRGMPNEPAYVAHTAACVARLRGVTVEALGQMTSRNAQRLFAPREKDATMGRMSPHPG
jgi:TatD DNase family protein